MYDTLINRKIPQALEEKLKSVVDTDDPALFVVVGIVMFVHVLIERKKANKLVETLPEGDRTEIIGILLGAIDAHTVELNEWIKEFYEQPDDVEEQHITEDDVYRSRVLQAFYSYMYVHGIEDFMNYIENNDET